MKYILTICLFLISCSSNKMVISSSYQHWVGGLKESGSGTNYTFKIVAPANQSNFSVETVYAHERLLYFNIFPKSFNRGDTLIISGSKSDQYWQSEGLPAKIEFQLNGKFRSLPINEMTKLDKLYYP